MLILNSRLNIYNSNYFSHLKDNVLIIYNRVSLADNLKILDICMSRIVNSSIFPELVNATSSWKVTE